MQSGVSDVMQDIHGMDMVLIVFDQQIVWRSVAERHVGHMRPVHQRLLQAFELGGPQPFVDVYVNGVHHFPRLMGKHSAH